MSIFDTLKRWVGLTPKTEPSKPDPAAEQPAERLQILPNGRVAVVDELGNFVRFKEGD